MISFPFSLFSIYGACWKRFLFSYAGGYVISMMRSYERCPRRLVKCLTKEITLLIFVEFMSTLDC